MVWRYPSYRRHERGGAPSGRAFRSRLCAGERGATGTRSPRADGARLAEETEPDAGRVCEAVPSSARHCARLGARRASSRQGRASAAHCHRKRPRRRGARARKLSFPPRNWSSSSGRATVLEQDSCDRVMSTPRPDWDFPTDASRHFGRRGCQWRVRGRSAHTIGMTAEVVVSSVRCEADLTLQAGPASRRGTA
jgi:hypothetical protein